jgi:hypothetical protein
VAAKVTRSRAGVAIMLQNFNCHDERLRGNGQKKVSNTATCCTRKKKKYHPIDTLSFSSASRQVAYSNRHGSSSCNFARDAE